MDHFFGITLTALGILVICVAFVAMFYHESRYLRSRIYRCVAVAVLELALMALVLMQAPTETAAGLRFMAVFGLLVITTVMLVEAFEPERTWHQREMRRIAIRNPYVRR